MNRIKWLSLSRPKQYQRLSLAFITMLLVTFLSANPSLTQQNSPERISVTKKIEATAVRHHEAKLPNVDHAVDEHKDEALEAGLTVPEIRKIYTQKMASLNKVVPWWQQPYNVPIAIALGVVASFRKAIINQVNKASQTLINKLYKRFSGTRLFRNSALRRYRTALIKKYQKLKIPFRPNRPLNMAEVYVPLQLLNQGEPLDAKKTVQNFKRLMIVGQPGSGKTMLLKSLALNYANEKWDIPQQPVAIILELNRLSDATLTIEKQLVKALERDDFPNGINFVEQGLKQGMIMLLFDGLDEVNSTDRPKVIQRLTDFIDTYDQCRVAITCRTQVYKREFDTQVNQTVEVVDFNDQQIRNFLQPWKESMSVDKSVEQLLNALQDRPRIMELARNPLMLTIIAYLYTDTAFVLPHSRAEFYQKATDILLETLDQVRQTPTPNRYKGRQKKLVLQHLALYSQDQTKEKQQDRRHLNWRDVNKQVASILPGLNLTAEADLDPILVEICERSGLLMPIDGGENYQFTHLTLQEFFAANHLTNNEDGLIERFEQDPDVWRETVKLWCGLSRDSTRLIRSVYQKDRVTAFSCLADAQNIEPDLATEIIDHFKGWLEGKYATQEDAGIDTVSVDSAIKAFGAVAADQRPRGRDVFDFLRQSLSQEDRSRDYAAQALAATNIPEAVQILANHCLAHTDIQPQLVRMGDLAVSKLKVMAEEGHISATQHLGEIATPLASKALIPLLRDKREEVALHAAIQLASLLKKTDIEGELKTYSPGKLQRSSQTWQGIWEPFDAAQNSSISAIAEQIVDQLNKGLQSQRLAKIDLPDLDPRIVLPIVFLSGQTFQKRSEDWIDTAQTLLENTEQGAQLERISPKLIANALIDQPQRLTWEVLLKTLPLRMQLDVLYRLSVNRFPTRNDWQNLYTAVTYDLRTSLHYRLVLPIVLLLSVIALFEAFEQALRSPEFWMSGSLVAYAFFIVPTVWLILWAGTEEPFEPNLFISFGIWGPISLFREYGRLLRTQIVWNGVQAIFDATNNLKNAICTVSAAVAVAIVSIFTFSSTFAVNITPVSTFTSVSLSTFTSATTSAVAIMVVGVFAAVSAGSTAADFVTFAKLVCTIFGTIFAAVIFLTTTTVSATAIFVAILSAGIGLGLWVRQSTEPKFIRYFAILASPFFFGSPVVVWFSTLFMHKVDGFSWPIIGLVWLGIVGFCTLLLTLGRRKERLAKNPLKGILSNYNADAA